MLVSTSCSVITLSILSIISITWSYTFLEFIHAFTSRHTPQTVHNYSFQGNDIPEMLQLDFGAFIQLDAEETVHFALNYPSASENEWLKSEPYGRGVIRLGPDKRAFLVSIFHQLHCLHYLESEIRNGNKTHWPHLQHCLNILRQWTLCQADITLEQGSFMSKNFTADRWGDQYTCRDWNILYDEMKKNWIEFYRYRVEKGIIKVMDEPVIV
ncbi:hypothetical protein C8J55DRAFT_462926 [Lentinula edodes]|uniref:Oxidase ustYa n=1 Tax=Lentinula lateritia TaxID=40482 RepID=A0A9W8ZRH1_9AGAR|nr:hypothetical protein F5877DRAFT_55016 [Lentinula edodes]KAJ4464864.1 hypothetical protein C8J55DRAFT_462926 [Lentinula edodes]